MSQQCKHHPNRISIHALLAESDGTKKLRMPVPAYFYPRSPCGERRDVIAEMTEAQSISIHALLAESDGLSYFYIIKITDFYPRSPCGERPAFDVLSVSALPISIHALLAESDRQYSRSGSKKTSYFYPRSPCGERLCVFWMALSRPLFLSTLSLRRATLGNVAAELLM